MRILLTLLCLSFFNVNSHAQTIDESQLVASLERTTCYGNCPYYVIKVYSNGWATFEGKKNVAFIGLHQAKVGEELVDQLIAKAQEIDYFNLNHKYPIKGLGIIDFPVCKTMIKKDNFKKIIYNRNDSPQSLVEYQEFFDELFEDIEWEKVEI